MRHDIVHGPSHALVKIQLDPNETVIAEAGAMVSHSAGLGMEVKMNAGGKAGCIGTIVAFFVAIVHGAALMLVPIYLGLCRVEDLDAGHRAATALMTRNAGLLLAAHEPAAHAGHQLRILAVRADADDGLDPHPRPHLPGHRLRRRRDRLGDR